MTVAGERETPPKPAEDAYISVAEILLALERLLPDISTGAIAGKAAQFRTFAEDPAGPVGPVVPVAEAPVDPVGPKGPVGPAAPVKPSPFAPVDPAGPVGPVDPATVRVVFTSICVSPSTDKVIVSPDPKPEAWNSTTNLWAGLTAVVEMGTDVTYSSKVAPCTMGMRPLSPICVKVVPSNVFTRILANAAVVPFVLTEKLKFHVPPGTVAVPIAPLKNALMVPSSPAV
jgi:hypothetical protein